MAVFRMQAACCCLSILMCALGNDCQSLLQSNAARHSIWSARDSSSSVHAALAQMPVAVEVAPGNPVTLNTKPVQCVYTANERRAVRCCGRSGSKVWMSNYGCIGSCSSCRSATYLEATHLCESAGYHLCTLDEALGPEPHSCATSKSCSTGCGMNGELFWTSTACQAPCPQAPAPNFQPWSRQDYDSSQQCDAADPHHCFGNGDCVCGNCVCGLGWRGPRCSQLDLLPAKKNAPGLPMNSANPTWGGAAVLEGGKVKFLAGGKRLKSTEATFNPRTYWSRSPAYDEAAVGSGGDPYRGNYPWDYAVDGTKNPFKDTNFKEADPAKEKYEKGSYLTLYESSGTDVGGPYIEKVPKWFRTFRADIKKSPFGSLLLLTNAGGGFNILESVSSSMDGPWTDSLGQAIDSRWANASAAEPDFSTPLPSPVYHFKNNGHCAKASWAPWFGTYVTGSGSATRACTADEMDFWACHLADPSFTVHPNGTTVIIFRGTRCNSTDHTERLGLLVSTAGWEGPYTLRQQPIFDDTEVQDGGLEDLFMWTDYRGTHVIVHSQARDHAYPPITHRSGFDHKKKRGAYFFSADGFVHWSLSDWELFPGEIRWDDNTTQFLLKQQRPSIVFDHLMQPQYLITGVDYLYDPCCDWYPFGSGWTLVQPIATTCPAGQLLVGSSCEACSADAAGYRGRCTAATTKYGQCVCATCVEGWQGDRCDTQSVVCNSLQIRNRCEDMGGEKEWFDSDVVADGECLSSCQAEARRRDVEGCCFQQTGDNPNCRFYPRQEPVSNQANKQSAAECSRR
eukprot:TRINITY_DN15470_c0_g1_i1.p1 TRINITY_DN15470_c0_g1~~TRINITY_DN15470_c0_g1_i1.p1  ORF type:complete len:793 (+),score=107.28 TRINITY_DN15470_c0_g1_i1:125-2503(+)